MNLIQLKSASLLILHSYLISHVATCSPAWQLCRQPHRRAAPTQRRIVCKSLLKPPLLTSPSGEPSPPAVHGQRGMGKAYRLGLVKQDDGGMPIVEYIVKYKTVSRLSPRTTKRGCCSQDVSSRKRCTSVLLLAVLRMHQMSINQELKIVANKLFSLNKLMPDTPQRPGKYSGWNQWA